MVAEHVLVPPRQGGHHRAAHIGEHVVGVRALDQALVGPVVEQAARANPVERRHQQQAPPVARQEHSPVHPQRARGCRRHPRQLVRRGLVGPAALLKVALDPRLEGVVKHRLLPLEPVAVVRVPRLGILDVEGGESLVRRVPGQGVVRLEELRGVTTLCGLKDDTPARVPARGEVPREVVALVVDGPVLPQGRGPHKAALLLHGRRLLQRCAALPAHSPPGARRAGDEGAGGQTPRTHCPGQVRRPGWGNGSAHGRLAAKWGLLACHSS
mmetsp:Transcript_10432/g.33721  ORF Transcript_10432/g.33721 Transcript_10432/m.33721 type:complete len:269 (+) Transcript_10432:505-1311(+)